MDMAGGPRGGYTGRMTRPLAALLVLALAAPSRAASAAAVACQSETDRLITAANPDGDSKVTASIRHDTEFRALKYVLQARGMVAPASGD